MNGAALAVAASLALAVDHAPPAKCVGVQTTTTSWEQAGAIAQDAYVYAFAMLENYRTLYAQAVDTTAKEYVGGFGVFRHYAEPFTPDNHDVMTPNHDMPYSWAWLDLRSEPWVLSVPAVPRDRYYVLQLVDLFTQNFAYVGVRSTGFGAGNYLVAGPKWHGSKPEGIVRVFQAETDLVGILGRTALAGPEDVPAVKALQAQYKLAPLSVFLGKLPPLPAQRLVFPPYDKAKAHSAGFIEYLNFLLQFAEPPYPGEVALRTNFRRIGIVPGEPWDRAKQMPESLAHLEAGVRAGQAAIDARAAQTFSSNGLFGSRAVLKMDYLTRDVAAVRGPYGNSREEAWYGGYDGNGARPSMLHFEKGQLPPARFFWSVTLYTLPDRLLYANALNRYSLGDRTKGLVYGKDGSLTLSVSHLSPGPGKEANWLPAPDGPYFLVVRSYGPKPELLQGKWKPPPLIPVRPAVQ